ncbi:MAG: Spy/CpxP family protein refolding chaperone [Planctomycetaceae bacterium]|nr:Spy/CpxP family protein refolding chaperone [Planctomycetaceae bacterium]
MRTGSTRRLLALAVIFGLPLALAVNLAGEERALRPEVQQLVQSVSERLQAAADKLGLSEEQRTKIREIGAAHSEQRSALRTERRNLLQEELKSVASILTPEQREKIKEFAEDRVEQARLDGAPGLPRFSAARDTLAERAQSAAEKLGLTSEQRQQIIQALSDQATRHALLRARCRDACENEFKAVAAVLTPEQRLKAREQIEDRIVLAAAARSVADRLDAAADKLNLSPDQRQQIAKAHSQFAGKYQALRSERLELMQEELKAMAAILTPEQREKVKDFCEDRVVLIEVSATGATADEAVKALRETISERLEAVADKLGLSADQRTQIRGVHASFAEKFKAQRDERKALREEELKALGAVLRPEQQDKVKDFVEDFAQAL